MAGKLLPLPAQSEALVLTGGVMNPVWYAFFASLQKTLLASGVAHYDFTAVDVNTLPANATFKFNTTTKKFTPS